MIWQVKLEKLGAHTLRDQIENLQITHAQKEESF